MADEQNIVTTIGIAAKADVRQATRGLSALTKKLTILQSVAKSLDGSTVSTLESLGQAMGDLSTGKNAMSASLPKNLEALGAALKSIDSTSTEAIASLAVALNELSANKNAVPASLSKKISALGSAIKTIDESAPVKLYALATSLKDLSENKSAVSASLPKRVMELVTALQLLNGPALSTLAFLARALEDLQRAKNAISPSLPERVEALGKAVRSMDITPYNIYLIKSLAGALEELKEVGSVQIKFPKLQGIAPDLSVALQTITDETAAPQFKDIENDSETATGAVAGLEEELTNLRSAYATLADEIRKTRHEQEQEDNETEEEEQKLGFLAKTVGKVTEKMRGFLSSLKRIAMYRLIRTVLKSITQGFREGIQNMYQYSLLINGKFKDSMDTLATSSLYLKNSMGALIAPLINQLAPVIDRLVDGFVDFTNVLAELFAMITGASTWTKALKYPKAYADAMDGAAGSAKELRATLLGFDEINRLDDNSRGGRGSAADLLDYSKMFEEVETRKLSDFWNDLLKSGEGKFALFAAACGTILAAKLGGALGGVFSGTGAAALAGKFAALFFAAFAGYRLGNWLYENDILGLGGFADYLMENGLGDYITEVGERLKNIWEGCKKWASGAWEFVSEKAFPILASWGESIKNLWNKLDLATGWDILEDFAIDWGDTILAEASDAWSSFKSWLQDNNVIEVDVDFNEPDWEPFKKSLAGVMQYVVNAATGGYTYTTTGGTNTYNSQGGHTYNPYDETPKKEPTKTGTSIIERTIANTMNNTIKKALGIIPKSATGGSFSTGDLFFANENGVPELVGQVGHKAQVANNDQITESIRVATMAGNAESTGLLRQAVGILNGILQKDNVVVAEVTTDSITNGLDRQNRRNGRTTVPIGV